LQFAKDDQTQAIQISTTLMLPGKQSISVQPQTMTHGSLPGYPLEWVSGINTDDLETTAKQNLKI
jgi:hypothetical protein